MHFKSILFCTSNKTVLVALLILVLGASPILGNSTALAYFPHLADSQNSVVNWNKFTNLMIQDDMNFFFGHTYSPTKSKYVYTITHVAIYNALLDAKKQDPLISEDAVVSGAAYEALSTLFPKHENRIGLFYNKQISSISGFEHDLLMKSTHLGKESARQFLAAAQTDDPNLPFNDLIPTGPCKWTGHNPATPDAGQWQTFFINDTDDYLANPPHQCNSVEDVSQLKEVYAVSKTRTSLDADKGRYYGEDIGFLLNDLIAPIILVENSTVLETAFTYAYVNAGMYDSGIVIWNSKYTYWTERPEKRISDLNQIIQSPNFPAYPSGHAGVASAAAVILSDIFPRFESYFMNLADEIAQSRLDVGVHYRQDNEEGTRLGTVVGNIVVEQMNESTAGPITYANSTS